METIQVLVVDTLRSGPGTIWKRYIVKPRVRDGLFDGSKFKAVGVMPEAEVNELLELEGEFEQHADYGHQFKVADAAFVIPEDLSALEKYLANRARGVGPVLAARMIKHFGTELRFILDNNPSRLREMDIAESTILAIDNAWNEKKHLRPLAIYLAGIGVKGKSWAEKVYKEFGANSIDLIKKNPYSLTQVGGIGFLRADEIALKTGWPESSPQRTEAACIYALEEATDNGHVFLYREELVERVRLLAGKHLTASKAHDAGKDRKSLVDLLEVELAEAAIAAVIERGDLREEEQVTPERTRLMEYLPSLHYMETQLADQITKLLSVPPRPALGFLKLIVEGEKAIGKTLSDKQQKAVIAALLNSFSVITGGPGTGKTTLQQVILYCMNKLGWDVFLAAPTGRAAKRMSQLAGQEAMTVHRLCGFGAKGWERNQHNPLDCDALFLDEWSMGDTDLTYRVMSAVPKGCHVVIIGDVDQLPSVGPGMVLRDLIDSGCIPVTRLDTIFRQAEGSLIIQNAHRILHGELPQFPERYNTKDDNFVLYVPQIQSPVDDSKKVDDHEWIYAKLRQLALDLPERYGVNAKTDIQVLSPMKKGNCGTDVLNQVLRGILNPDAVEFDVNGHEYRIGDRVMQMKNNYILNVFNGDIGVIVEHVEASKTVKVQYDKLLIPYSYDDLKQIRLAFASTVHKVQGSEIPIVIIVLLNQHYTMLERNLVYTALTRAKKMCLFITGKRALAIAVQRCQIQKRNSYLGDRIRLSVAGQRLALPPASISMPAQQMTA